MNINHLTFQSTKEKYLKFKKRLEKSISSGKFQKLSRRKKNQLISRVEKFRSRLEGSSAIKKGAMIAGTMALIPSLAFAQDPALRFERSDFALDRFGTNQQVEIANIDADADLEVLISTDNGGYVLDKNQNGFFEYIVQGDLNNMNEEFYLGDVDEDDDVDIVFRNGGALYLALNDGDGNFELIDQEYYVNSSTILTGGIGFVSNPQDVDLVDFDSDGDLDLTVSNSGGQIRHFSNDGSGSFQDGENLTISDIYSGLSDFEFADLDGDGDMDLIHNLNSGAPYTSVYVKENTAGTSNIPVFSGANREIYSYKYSQFEEITVFDMDGDSDLDIFFANNGYDNHKLFQNRDIEDGLFDFIESSTSGFPSSSVNDVAVADLDGDGNDDLLLSFASDSKVGIFDGSALEATSRSLNGEIGDAVQVFSSVAIGDIDEDGLEDIIGITANLDPYIYYDLSAPNISVFDGDVIIDENVPAGVFANLTISDFHDDPIDATLGGNDASLFALNTLSGELSTTQAFDWESLGSELDLDIILSDGIKTRTERFNIRINNINELGQGYLDPQEITLFSSNENTSSLLAGDLDMDGDDDLVIGDSNLSRINILFNNGIGLVSSPNNPYADFKDIVFNDFDDDGDLDLFALRSNEIDAVVNKGLEFDKYDLDGGYVNSESFGLIAGDFDNDGLEDIATISSGGSYISFRKFELSEDNRTLTEEQELPFKTGSITGYLESYGNIVDLAIADFDGDDNDDLLVITEDEGLTPGTDVLFSGDGNSFSTTFSPFTALQTDNGYNRAEIEDLDGDGSIDIVAFRDNGTNIDIDIMLNDGTGVFTVSQTLATSGVNDESGDELTDLLFADMDGNGTLDIISTTVDGVGEYELRMFFNDGNGAFNLAQTMTDFNGIDIELIDIDNDDDTDVMVREIGDNSDVFSVYLNTNIAASDISLSSSSFDEHLQEDTRVATISVTDINPEDVHILYLAEGDGTNDEHNNFFFIDGNRLEITRDVRAEEFPTLNILVAADDGENVYQQAFELTVNDVNQTPTAIELSTDVFDESILPGSAVSDITVTDPNDGDLHTLSLVDGTGSDNNDSFTIQGNQLILIESIEFNDNATLSVRIAADDGRETFEQALTLTVNEVLGLNEELRNVLGIYPNPGHNEILFNIDNELLGEMLVSVTDLAGRSIHQFESEKTGKTWTHSLDMSDQETGVYVIEVTIGKMKVTQRWIKQD